MDFKKFFKERFGDKEIEIKQETEEPYESIEIIEKEAVDTHATRRRLFENKMLRVLALGIGLNISLLPKDLDTEKLSPHSEEYKKEYAELSKKLGSQFDGFLFQMETYKAQKEHASEDIHLKVGDFEEADASSAEVKSYLEKGYPKEWLTHVNVVHMVPFDLDVPEEYGLKNVSGKGTAKAIAYVEKRGNLGGSSIVFSKEIKNFFSAVSHELGHANDWLGRTDLPDEYRIDLLYKVIKRVESPDRFKSAYVESINNQDPNKQLMNKATEYWAEIVGEYLDHPKEAKTKLAPADLTLIEEHLRVSASNFNLEKAVMAREVRGKIIKQEVIEKYIKTAIEDNDLKNGDALISTIKDWTMVEARVSETDSVYFDAENELDQEIMIDNIFSHGNKKWLKVDQAFLSSMKYVDFVASIYKNANVNEWLLRKIKDYIETYKEEVEKIEKEMKKFSPTEQNKIKKFHQYLERALREADILPSSVAPDNYYK